MKITESILRKIVRSEIKKSLVKENYTQEKHFEVSEYRLYFRGVAAAFQDLLESYGFKVFRDSSRGALVAIVPLGADVDPHIPGRAYQIDKIQHEHGDVQYPTTNITQIDADDLMRELSQQNPSQGSWKHKAVIKNSHL